MYKTILMPTDGSECSQKAIQQGLEVAKNLGATVRFVYALENPTSAMWISPESLPYGMELLEDLKKVGQQAVDKAVQMAAEAGVGAEARLVEGRPVDVILEAAKDADLIVMGTHGRSGLDRFMLGSVTESVLHKASKPVLVMRSR
ncbi:MAG: universal stress protein [Meiothermus sp.]|nr:universal stress protein [Meiothermus sp.]